MSRAWARRLAEVVAASAASAALCAASAFLSRPADLLMLVALVPWLWVLDRSPTARWAAAAGVVMAAAFSLAVLGWFATAMASFTGAPRGVAWILLAVGSPFLEPQLPLAALARFLAGRRKGRWSALTAGAAFALAWVAAEWGLPKLLGDTIGHALQPAPALRQAADLGGAAGLTLLVLAASELALATGRALARRGAGAAAAAALALGALLAAWTGYGELRLAQLRDAAEAGEPITVGVIQSNIVRYDRLARERGRFEVVREVLDVHEGLSRELVRRAAVDLLVWPETVYPATFGAPRSETGAELDREIERFASGQGVPLAFGAYLAQGGREYNAAFFLQPAGGELHRSSYRKAYLFPLTEWTPGWLGRPWARRLLPWSGGWTPGPGPQVADLLVHGRRLRVAPLLCYDAVHPALAAAEARAGAGLLLALSNDAWFTSGPGARLHLAVAAFRAIETRLPLARAAPSGISAAVDPSGEILAAAGVDERAALAVELVPGPALAAPFLLLGGLLGPVALAGAVLLAVAGARPRRVPGARPRDPPIRTAGARVPAGADQRRSRLGT